MNSFTFSILQWIQAHPNCKAEEIASRFSIDLSECRENITYLWENQYIFRSVHPFGLDQAFDLSDEWKVSVIGRNYLEDRSIRRRKERWESARGWIALALSLIAILVTFLG